MKNSAWALVLAVSFYLVGQSTIGGVYVSPIGFDIFYLASAGFNLASLWTAANLDWQFFKSTLETILKLLVGISPFILLQPYIQLYPIWLEFLAMMASSLVLFGLIYSALKPLVSMRIDNHEGGSW